MLIDPRRQPVSDGLIRLVAGMLVDERGAHDQPRTGFSSIHSTITASPPPGMGPGGLQR